MKYRISAQGPNGKPVWVGRGFRLEHYKGAALVFRSREDAEEKVEALRLLYGANPDGGAHLAKTLTVVGG